MGYGADGTRLRRPQALACRRQGSISRYDRAPRSRHRHARRTRRIRGADRQMPEARTHRLLRGGRRCDRSGEGAGAKRSGHQHADMLTEDVADFAFAVILAHLRKVIDGDAHVRSGAWSAAALPLGSSLRGKTLGILGFGRIGRAIARRAEGFGVSIAYCDVAPAAGSASVYCDSPIALARASDILVAAVAGGEATRNMVDADVFEALGPSGLFVNVSGGSVVDEPALIQALAQRRIGGACLDVFWNEPNVDRRFLEFDNVILQPHQSSGTVETRKAMGKLVRDNLEAHFAGRSLVTPVV